ncbi:gamma-glutamyltransferase [Tamilnaduibacter salinus]|uniref:gamma-glutamyltransferase n=1 Tax=Tamilnaduibacter salinus TaxID=1484056 RepID=UPI001D174213|nr:gamma-glutamyltransferase [Tamilnaduibacter salinus]
MMLLSRTLIVATLLALAGCATTPLSTGTNAVASAHPLATQAGLQALQTGGNAFDAAIATAAVLAVVEPYSAGMGGGGFWLLQKRNRETVMIDARETAPGQSHPDMYLNEAGEVRSDQPSLNGPLAAGIPGQPAAFAHINRLYAERPLRANLAAAIRLARQGFRIDERYRDLASWRRKVLRQHPDSARVFLHKGKVPETGTLLRQPALADTLEQLAEDGAEGFYSGPVARQLVEDVQAAGGIWTKADLAAYQIIERDPVTIRYRDAVIQTASLPSSGGMALAQMFGMMAERPITELYPEPDAVDRIHYRTELMRRAYRDRARHMGDPAYTDVPRERLRSSDYLARQAGSIEPLTASDSRTLFDAGTGGRHTTHLSVLDSDGRRVSATLSINWPFGSGFLSGQTGILLNNEMNDFAIKPGVPNAYGLVGGKANQVEAGKRPLSSMSPTLIDTPQRSAIIGTPGGSRIISMVFLGLLDVMDGHPAGAIVSRPRYHHQYQPDQIQHEPEAFTPDQRFRLQALGHRLENVGREYGNMQLILTDHTSGQTQAVADPRGIGQAIAQPVD